jgi:bifunctional non-homologous end joining protein LigD
MPLDEYNAKRDFSQTREPAGLPGKPAGTGGGPIFVVQEHHASHLHYDFRLECDGVLKSWAVPKGPSLDPSRKRLAVQVEDHPLGYAAFEGTIPEGQYGAGTVRVWDRGTYEPAPGTDFASGLASGRLEFVLHGERLRGQFTLLRMKGRGADRGKPQWLLIKGRDEFARAEPRAAEPAPEQRPGPAAPKVRAAPVRTKAAARGSGDGVAVTHPDKVLFPDAGLTKADVASYYRRVARRLLPFLKDRPATLERLPEGLTGPDAPHFWQKDTPDTYPDFIPRVELPSERGKPVRYALVNDERALLYLVNQGALTFHVWASRVADLDRPDFVLFDLDPGPAGFAAAVVVAKAVRDALTEEGAPAFVKTSGKSGLHVLTPWGRDGGYDAARAWALGLAQRVAGALPDAATVEVRKAKRRDRVYIDVLQNARGHHAVPPYVLRAVPRATVSTPLNWNELTDDLTPSSFTPEAVLLRLSRQTRDPFAPLLRSFGARSTRGWGPGKTNPTRV